MKNNIRVLLIMISIILLISLFLIINLLAVDNKKIGNKSTTTQIKKDEITNDILIIEGLEETIKVRKYDYKNEYSVNYDINYFSPSLLNNGVLVFTSLYNDRVMLRIEKLNAMPSDLIEESIEDGNRYTYKYIEENNKIYKITTIVPSDNEYNGYYIRMGYMIEKFKIY